jgi:hypothetical protein
LMPVSALEKYSFEPIQCCLLLWGPDMKRRDKAAGKAVKVRRRKTLTLKRHNAPKVARRRISAPKLTRRHLRGSRERFDRG